MTVRLTVAQALVRWMRNRLATFACTASIGPGSTNMITGAALASTQQARTAYQAAQRDQRTYL